MITLAEIFSNLITPAILLAVLGYLIRLFGRIITDAEAFVDDYKWHVELSGLMFAINYIAFPGLVAVLLLYFNPIKLIFSFWVGLVMLTLVTGMLYVNGSMSGKTFYKLPELKSGAESKNNDDSFQLFFEKFLSWLNKPFSNYGLFLISIVLMLILCAQAGSTSTIKLAILILYNFIAYIFICVLYSLNKSKQLSQANIYFISGVEPVRDCLLLKINNDNLRVRVGDQLFIINKNQVLKVEIYKKISTKAKKN